MLSSRCQTSLKVNSRPSTTVATIGATAATAIEPMTAPASGVIAAPELAAAIAALAGGGGGACPNAERPPARIAIASNVAAASRRIIHPYPCQTGEQRQSTHPV